jgi:hypothetical protein
MGSVQKGHIRTYPTVIFDDDALPRGSLLPDGHIETVILMILRMKTYMLPHDDAVPDEDSSAGPDE